MSGREMLPLNYRKFTMAFRDDHPLAQMQEIQSMCY
jgi:hypothetical protein